MKADLATAAAMRLGMGGRFKKMQGAIERENPAMSPERAAAITAAAGRKKYGKQKFQDMAAAGRSRHFKAKGKGAK